MTNLLRFAPCLALGAVLVACDRPGPPPPASNDTPPHANVVLVVMDTLRADRVEATRNGLPVMPFLARMAREGTYYTHAISPCSWTKPALASVFTGVYPGRHGVTFSARDEDPEHPASDRLAEEWETMAEWFAAQGYTPWGFQTNANLTRALGFAQGFGENAYHFHNGAPAPAVTGSALGALPSLPQPFFAYVHYMDPHAPYTPEPGLIDALGPLPELTDDERALLEDDARFMAYYMDQVKTAIGLQPAHTMEDLSAAGKEAVRHRYDLECLAMDRAMEALFEAVRAQSSNTIFVFLSDHGEEFWERGGMGHGTTLHQEQVRVPLIIHDPAQSPDRRGDIISTIRLLPLLAERLGLPRADTWSHEGAVLSFTRGPWAALRIHKSAAFDAGYAYVRDHVREESFFYPLPSHPAARAGTAPPPREIADRLRRALDDNRDSSMDHTAPPSVPLGESEIEALEAIGYLDHAAP